MNYQERQMLMWERNRHQIVERLRQKWGNFACLRCGGPGDRGWHINFPYRVNVVDGPYQGTRTRLIALSCGNCGRVEFINEGVMFSVPGPGE